SFGDDRDDRLAGFSHGRRGRPLDPSPRSVNAGDPGWKMLPPPPADPPGTSLRPPPAPRARPAPARPGWSSGTPGPRRPTPAAAAAPSTGILPARTPTSSGPRPP